MVSDRYYTALAVPIRKGAGNCYCEIAPAKESLEPVPAFVSSFAVLHMRIVTGLLIIGLAATPATMSGQDSTARPAPPPGALAAANDLLVAMNSEQVMRVGATAAFDAQVKAQPLMAPFVGVMKEWAERTLTMKEMGPALARVYAEIFSEPELRQIIAFYRSPVGRKLAGALPQLTLRGMEIGSAVAEAHSDELQEMIAKRAAEIQANPPPQ